MSNMKKQTSWQEDIARNFSRLFQRSKSQDPEKTEEQDISPSSQENGVYSLSSLSSETSDADPAQLLEEIDLSEAFGGVEERRGGERGEPAGEGGVEEEQEEEAAAAPGGGQGGAPDDDADAGGSPEVRPPAELDAPGSPPVSPPSPPPPPVETSFLKRLGSLFHFKTTPQPEERQKVEEEEEEEEEEGGTATENSGMTCQGHCDTAERLEDDDWKTEMERERREGETEESVERPFRSGTDQETEERPAQLGTDLETEGRPSRSGTDLETEERPAQLGTDLETEERPAQLGTDLETEERPAQLGTDLETEERPAQLGTDLETEERPAQSGTDLETEERPAQLGTDLETEERPAQLGTDLETEERPAQLGTDLETEGRPAQLGTDLQTAPSSSRLVDTDTRTLEDRSSDACAADRGSGRGEVEAPGGGPLKDAAAADECRRRALSCPPVVTYGTYRGQREHRRTRRRPPAIAPPIPEAGETQQRGDGASGGEAGASTESACRQGEDTPPVSEPATSESDGAQTPSTNQIAAPDSEVNEKRPPTPETFIPAGPSDSFGHIPVVARIADSPFSQSAFLSSREGDMSAEVAQDTDPLPGDEAVRDARPEPSEDPADGDTRASVSETRKLDREPPAETADRDAAGKADADEGPTGRTETSSAPSDPAAWLASPAAVAGDSQQAPGSPSAKGPAPTTGDSDRSGVEEGGVIPSEGGLSEDRHAYEEALCSESITMVDSILRNALVALERIGSSELDLGTFQSSGQEAAAVSAPAMTEADFGGSSEPDKLLGAGQSEVRDDALPVSVEQTLSSGQVLGEGPRSTPSSGYESIAGSDTDIRSSPGPACDGSCATVSALSVLDELCPEETAGIGHHAEVKGRQLRDADELPPASDAAPPPSDDIAGSKRHGTDQSEPAEKQGLHGDGDIIIRAAGAGDDRERWPASGTASGNEGQAVFSAGGGDYGEAGSVGGIQAWDVAVRVAEEDAGSDRHGGERERTRFDSETLPNGPGNPKTLDSSPNDAVSPLEYHEKRTPFPESPSTDPERESKVVSELDVVSVRPKRTQQGSEAGYAASSDLAESRREAQTRGAGIPVESLFQTAPRMTASGPGDSSITGDRGFILVETYLASVIEDGSDSGGEEDGDPASSRGRPPGDLRSSEGPLSPNPAPGPGDGEGPQRSPSRATRHNAPLAPPPLHPPTGRRGGHIPDLTACVMRAQALGPLPLLDLHELEASGFAIIDEEEETDAVFVNDTGPALSPGARRAKSYPFSLSPIVEEDGFRADGEEEGLLVPPATEEELRSLSGGGGAEQGVSASALSVLSLLQSVSERLQSSAFSETDPEEEASSTRQQRTLWECFFNRDKGEEEEEEEEEDGRRQATDDDQRFPLYPPCSRRDGPDAMDAIGSLGGSRRHERDERPAEEKNDWLSPQTAVQKPADTPFYQYLRASSSMFPQPDPCDPCGRHAKLIPSLTDQGPSNKPDEEENRSYGKFTPRPTLMHIYDGVKFSGERWEIQADQEDAWMAFKGGASVRVLGGCWLLYLEPGFKGPGLVLEEGETVLTHQPGRLTTPEDKPTAVTIGSLRRLVKDDRTPEIHLLPSGGSSGGVVERFRSQTDSLEGPVRLSNLSVQSGCWLAYDRPGCHGNYVVMEAGGPSTPGPGQPQVTGVRSLRPLRRGGLKVRRPMDPKMLVFELPLFQGRSRELLGHTPSLGTSAGLKGVASLRVVGGVWAGYTGEAYTGQQFVLEDGEHGDCEDPGGATRPRLLSFRFLQADFVEPLVSLQDESGAEKTDILDLDVPDLQSAGAAEKTSSICVKNGVWVAYSERAFSGEQCILEKGKHPGTPAKSIRPVRLGVCGAREPKHSLRVYSQPHFAGATREYEGEESNCGADAPMSLRVIRGSWLLFDEEGCRGNQYVLGEGLYPDLISCGCVATSVKSLRPIPYNFSDPSLCLFSLDSYEGVMTGVVTSADNVTNIFTQSLRVDSGLWVVFEFRGYKGRQMLLQPGSVPNWGEHSGWDTIGSVRPLKPPRVYVQVRSRVLGSVLTAEDVQDDSSPARLFLSPARSLDTQLWVLTDGLLRCKASKGCLSVIGAKATAGTRVAVWPEHGRIHQRWSLNQDGTLSSHLNHNLVLDFRGGTGFDKDHLVVNEFSSDQATQYWDIEMV